MKYPLAELQLIKQKKLEEAEKELRRLRGILAEEEEKLNKAIAAKEEVLEHQAAKLNQLREAFDQGTRSDKIEQMRNYLKVVKEKLLQKELEVEKQEQEVEKAKDAVEEGRKEMLKRQQEVEKLRLHKEEWEKELQKEVVKEEARETDEMGSVIHIRKQRGEKK